MNHTSNVTITSSINDSYYNVTLSSNVSSSYETFITVLQTTIIAVISSGIVLSNIINLIVLVSASAAMPWATRLFLMNLSVSDLLVGVIACTPAVIPAATHRWIYGDYLRHYLLSLTGGYTVKSGVKYRELFTACRVLPPSGA